MFRIFFILLSILPYPLRRDLRTNFYRYYFEAVYHVKSGNITEAEEKADIAYNTVRNKEEAFLSLYLLGMIKAYQSSWSRAKYYIENALMLAKSRKDSMLIEPWMLYVSYYDDGLYSTYELVKSFNTNIPEERIFRSLYLVEEERYDEAIAMLGDISMHSANYIRAYVYYKKGMLDSALYYIEKLAEFNNIERTFYATLLYLNGDYTKAHEVIEETEKSDVYSVLLQALVESKLGSEEIVKTYTKYRDILINKPEFSKIVLMVAGMYFKRKDYRGVVRVLEESIDWMDEVDKKKALFYLGTSYVFLKRYANAVRTWQEYLKYPDINYDYAHFQLGRSAYQLELDSMVKEHLIRIHDTSSYFFWGLYLYARLLLKNKMYDPAKTLLTFIEGHKVERSLRRRVYFNLGKIFIKEKMWDSAQVIFNKMLNLGFVGPDVDSAEYFYEYSKFRLGEYLSPIELNLKFSEKYPDNIITLGLLDEVITYFMTFGKMDSVYFALLKRRALAQDSIYESEYSAFLNALGSKDTIVLDSLMGVIGIEGTDFERLELAKKLMNLQRNVDAIDILQGISGNNKRLSLLLIAKAYGLMGKVAEMNLVLNDIFPPYDSIGGEAFKEFAVNVLKVQGIDSFYTILMNNDVPDSLKSVVLKKTISILLMNGDTLNALEFKARLKELTGDKDAMEEH